jgi:hypothetical protein
MYFGKGNFGGKKTLGMTVPLFEDCLIFEWKNI